MFSNVEVRLYILDQKKLQVKEATRNVSAGYKIQMEISRMLKGLPISKFHSDLILYSQVIERIGWTVSLRDSTVNQSIFDTSLIMHAWFLLNAIVAIIFSKSVK